MANHKRKRGSPSTSPNRLEEDTTARKSKRLPQNSQPESHSTGQASSRQEDVGTTTASATHTPSCQEHQPTSHSRQDQSKATPSTFHIALKYQTGDLFATTSSANRTASNREGTLLVHACNCEGTWGAGVAATFKALYPAAYQTYRSHCREKRAARPGTALLIPPLHSGSPPSRPASSAKDSSRGKGEDEDEDARRSHYIGCLFTSRSKGRARDSPAQIVHATRDAMADLVAQVRRHQRSVRGRREGRGGEGDAAAGEDLPIGEVKMCKINAGLFGVPWDETRKALEAIEVGVEVDGEEDGEDEEGQGVGAFREVIVVSRD